MTSDSNSTRPPGQDAEVATGVPRTDAGAGPVDASVVPVGTFAAGQSADGRHVAATTAPRGSFAAGQADEVAREMIRPEVTQVPRPGPSPHAAQHMQDATSDLTFRPPDGPARRRADEAWEAVLREELVKLRRRSPSGPRVVPASRQGPYGEPGGPGPDASPPETAETSPHAQSQHAD
jgi:hypothetical protein